MSYHSEFVNFDNGGQSVVCSSAAGVSSPAILCEHLPLGIDFLSIIPETQYVLDIGRGLSLSLIIRETAVSGVFDVHCGLSTR